MGDYIASDSGETTGAVSPDAGTVPTAAYWKVTDVHDDKARQYSLPYSRTVAGSAPADRVRPPASPLRDVQATKHAFNSVFQGLRQAAEELRTSPEDPMQRALRVDALEYALECLWDLRHQREEDWGDLINIIQIMLKKEDAEDLRPEQIQALAEVVERFLTIPRVGLEDVRRAIAILSKAGFNVWSGLSGVPEDEQHAAQE